MVWHLPQNLERSRQDRWRAGFIWGVFVLLVAAALGMQVFVPRSLQVELSEPVKIGSLSMQMPAGWHITDQGTTIVASEGGPTGQRLTANLRRARKDLSLLEVISAGYDENTDQVRDSARRVSINGRPALLLEGVSRGPGGPAQIVRLAFAPTPDSIALVQLESPVRNSKAEVVVQQVARTIRVEFEE